MDPAARAATRSLVAELRSAGTTILLTTHDLGDVERLADRVAILHRGHVVALASPAEIAGGGRARLRVRLDPAAGAPALSALETRLGRGRVEADPARGPGWIAGEGTAVDPALVAEVAAWAADARVLIAELRAGGGTLEERYLELTGDADVARDGTSEAGT
jgi:ABC-2 type transport system ATP-binding protein